MEYPVTSVTWCPDGELFAAGSFNVLRLCDKTGWTYSKQRTETGSLLNIAWTSDGTQLSGAGGNGSVCFGQIIDRTIEWMRLSASLEVRSVVAAVTGRSNSKGTGVLGRWFRGTLA